MPFTKDTLTNLDIFLGDKCNLKCMHCPCWLNRTPLELPPELMWERVAEALAFADDHCSNFLRSMIIGGEPFSHPGLAEFLRDQPFRAMLTVYTNFAHELPDYQWAGNVRFITSMDAADDATYRRTRRTRDFPTVVRNLRRNAPWVVHADTTVSRFNFERLDDILEFSRPIGCTHWFLPIDPRMLRYAGEHADDRRVQKTADVLSHALLDEDILAAVRDFFDRHPDDPRINRYGMFHGLYLSGTEHFDDLPSYGAEIRAQGLRHLEGCQAGERYLEVTLDGECRFVPVLYCPGLMRRHPQETVPHFDRFADLIEWLTAAFADGQTCQTFCARTQFLGIDDYTARFKEVELSA